jgi:serine/threonine-protein kinase RsbW
VTINRGEANRRTARRSGIESNPTAQAAAAVRLKVDALATLDALPFVSETIEQYLVRGLGLSSDTPEPMLLRLAIQEAITNVIRHSYTGQEPGRVVLELFREEDEIVAVVSDQGIPFDPTSDQYQMPDPDQLVEGGRGIGIIRQVMGRIDYHYDAAHGNQLTMRKKLWGVVAPSAAPPA